MIALWLKSCVTTEESFVFWFWERNFRPFLVRSANENLDWENLGQAKSRGVLTSYQQSLPMLCTGTKSITDSDAGVPIQ